MARVWGWRTATVLLLWAANTATAAQQLDAWRTPAVQQGITLWVEAQALEAIGRPKEALTSYQAAVEHARKSLAAGGADPAGQILAAILERAKAGSERLAQLPDKPVSEKERVTKALACLALLKAEADQANANGDVVAARLDYTAVKRVAALFAVEFPTDAGLKAAAWVERRSTELLRELAHEAGETERDPAAGDNAGAKRPGPETDKLGAELNAAVKTYLRGDGKELISWEALEKLLAALEKGRMPANAALVLADRLAKGAGAAAGPVTMGATDSVPPEFQRAAMQLYLGVLSGFPAHPKAELTVGKALELHFELADPDQRVQDLYAAVEAGNCGGLPVLLYRIEKARGQEEEAKALMARMVNDPDRLLPRCPASRAVLEDAVRVFRKSSRTTTAERAAELLGVYKPKDMGEIWLALAEDYRRTGRGDDARRLFERVVRDYPRTRTAADAEHALKGNKPDAPKTVLTEEQLAAMAEQAKSNPHQYLMLAAEYRKAGRYAEARAAYLTVALRSDDPEARLAAVETFFDEGKEEEGVRSAVVYIYRYPDSPGAEKLAPRVRRFYVEKGQAVVWADECLRISEGLDPQQAKPYLNDVANALLRLVLNRDSSADEVSQRLLRSTLESKHRQQIESLTTSRVRSLRGEVKTFDVASAGAQSADGGAKFAVGEKEVKPLGFDAGGDANMKPRAPVPGDLGGQDIDVARTEGLGPVRVPGNQVLPDERIVVFDRPARLSSERKDMGQRLPGSGTERFEPGVGQSRGAPETAPGNDLGEFDTNARQVGSRNPSGDEVAALQVRPAATDTLPQSPRPVPELQVPDAKGIDPGVAVPRPATEGSQGKAIGAFDTSVARVDSRGPVENPAGATPLTPGTPDRVAGVHEKDASGASGGLASIEPGVIMPSPLRGGADKTSVPAEQSISTFSTNLGEKTISDQTAARRKLDALLSGGDLGGAEPGLETLPDSASPLVKVHTPEVHVGLLSTGLGRPSHLLSRGLLDAHLWLAGECLRQGDVRGAFEMLKSVLDIAADDGPLGLVTVAVRVLR